MKYYIRKPRINYSKKNSGNDLGCGCLGMSFILFLCNPALGLIGFILSVPLLITSLLSYTTSSNQKNSFSNNDLGDMQLKYFDREPKPEDYMSKFDIFVTSIDAGLFILTSIVFFVFSYYLKIIVPFLYTFFVIFGVMWFCLRKYKNYINAKRLYQEQLHRQAKEYWYSMDGWTFEKELAKLYRILGYSAEVTKGSGDGGVDIILEKDDKVIFVQCKAYKDPLGPAPVRELYGVMKSEGVHYGVLAGLAGFSNAAKEFAEKNNIQLIDIDDVIRMSKNNASPVEEDAEIENIQKKSISENSKPLNFWDKGIYKN